MAADPSRSSQRPADRVPTVDALYLTYDMYDTFVDDLKNHSNGAEEWQVKAFWADALRIYFPQIDGFSGQTEIFTKGKKRADIVVFYLRETNEAGEKKRKPWLVMEIKGATPSSPVGWRADGESKTYAAEICSTYGIDGIWSGAAEGRLVKFYKYKRAGGGAYEPLATSKPNHRISPMDVIEDQRFIHEMITTMRQTRPFS